MARELPLWVGKTHNAQVPPRVRLRIFLREDGKCWITGRKIRPGEKWELDHRIALINGGEHSEANLFPALADAHRAKTNDDVALKAKIARVAAKHNGAWPKSKNPIRGGSFGGGPSKRQQREAARQQEVTDETDCSVGTERSVVSPDQDRSA